MASPILVLDAFSLLYRAFYALPPLTTKAGEPTAALYGFSTVLLKLVRERKPRGLVVARDLPRKTFRHERYEHYKETRTSPPSALGRQVGRLSELIEAVGCPVFASPGFEADDVLATLARELAAAGEHAMVVSGDRDALQLARGTTTVLYVARGVKDTLYDAAAVEKRFGVPAEQLPDYIALVGDTSDNLPGIDGVGPQTAAGLIRRYGGVAGVLEGLATVTPPRLRDALAARREELAMWRDLARLRDDVPLADGPRWAPIDVLASDRLRSWYTELEMVSLVPRLEEALAALKV